MAVACGIRTTAYGYQAYVRQGGILKTRHFRRGTALNEMTQWREQMRARLLLHLETAAHDRQQRAGTFVEDVAVYLAAVRAMPTYQEREKHIKEWLVLFGTRPRTSITPAEIRAQLQVWRQAGYAASSVNHRRTALAHLFAVLNSGTIVLNPVSVVPKVRPPDPQPRGLPPETIGLILRSAKRRGTTKSYARLLVLAQTGLPPCTLARITRTHWDAERQVLFVPGRLKGRGTAPRYLPLTDEAQRALTTLNRVDGWGAFDTSALNRVYKRAATAAKVAGGSLYSLRHSFGSSAYAASGDLQAVAELMGHADLRMTRRYALAALSPRATAALRAYEKVAGRIIEQSSRRKS